MDMKNLIFCFFLVVSSQIAFSKAESDLTLPEGVYKSFSEERFKKAVKFHFSNVLEVYNIVFEEEFYIIEGSICVLTLGACSLMSNDDYFSVSFTVETSSGNNKDVECRASVASPRKLIAPNQAALRVGTCKSEEVVIPVEMVISLEPYPL